MMILKEPCKVLGLPEPKSYETQAAYVRRIMLGGFRLDTRVARSIGIGNLHSVIAQLRKKGFPLVVEHSAAYCPVTGDIPPYKVDVIHMSRLQIAEYTADKEKPSEACAKEG